MERDEKPATSKAGALSAKEYEDIGRALESVLVSGYANKRRLVAANFVRGLFFGLGTTLGAGILLAVLIYMLTLFSDLPLIGRLFEQVEETIQNSQDRSE